MIRKTNDFIINLDENLREEYLEKFNNIIKDYHIIIEKQELKYDKNKEDNEYYKCIDKNVFQLVDYVKTAEEVFDLNSKVFKINQKEKIKKFIKKIKKTIKGENNEI